MPFSDAVKLRVKQRADFSCCICREFYVEVHHIDPQEHGGSDDEDNAAPLCPSCHERYGANPTKRKLIREVRDHWYGICAERRAAPSANSQVLQQISEQLTNAATKADLEKLVEIVANVVKENVASRSTSFEEARKQVAHMGSTLTSAGPMMFEPMVYLSATICSRCGALNTVQEGNPHRCSNCGQQFPRWGSSLLDDESR